MATNVVGMHSFNPHNSAAMYIIDVTSRAYITDLKHAEGRMIIRSCNYDS